MPKNVVVATGIPKLNHVFFGNEKVKKLFTVVASVENKNNVESTLKKHPDADILLVSDGLVGKGESLTQIMINVRFDFPHIRVVYLTSEVKKSQLEQRMKQLGPLARSRVYDIVAETPLNPAHILRALRRPAEKEDVEWIFNYINSEEEMNAPKETIEIFDEGKGGDGGASKKGIMPNLSVFSSIKPGTGKSFVAANVATIIAKYGKKNEKGDPPRVALIDGDMQNLSIGTLLQVEDDNKNLRTVMDKIHSVVDKEGKEIDNPPLIADARAFVRSAFLPYPHVKNLEVLGGSQLQWEKLQDFRSSDFVWLLKCIEKDYDVIIMDSSSSLNHISTYPMMMLSKQMYYILNLDFNNVRNNSRYQRTLSEELGVFDKVKYILNEDITKEHVKENDWNETLEFDAAEIKANGFDVAGAIPMIEKPTFLNRIFLGEPIVLDDQPHTLEARVALAQIADQVWGIDKLPYLEDQLAKQRESNQTKRKGLFSKK